MLLEMQSAMNNMMNSSQLQTLPANEPVPPVTTEPTSEEAGHASSHSPSSQSDSSADPEPAVAMDTSPSSASPSASDSSEEEVIGSVTRAHQETFMYNQEQSGQMAEAPPSTGSTHNYRAEEQQDAWNHRNNLVTMAAQGPPTSRGPHGQQDNNMKHCPFRMSRTSDTNQCPTYSNQVLRAASMGGPHNGGPHNREPQSRGGNRMYLVIF